MMKNQRLCLASQSPRRLFLLQSLGYEVHVVPPNIDETQRAGESPEGLAKRLALEKAQAVSSDLAIVAADTIVVLDSVVFGKPESDAHAVEILSQLAGKTHHVMSGYAVRKGSQVESGLVKTAITFLPLTLIQIQHYVATGEPRDKSGAYAISGQAAAFVHRVEGSLTSVIGLPVGEVIAALERVG